MKKELSAILLAAGATLFALGLLCFAVLFGGLRGMQQSQAQIATFAAAPQTEPFTNTSADEPPDVPAAPEPRYALAAVTAPEGFVLKSYSQYWDEAQLHLLREELLKNRHGPELETLNEVRVMAQGDYTAAAKHTSDVKVVDFQLKFGALPPEFTFPINLDISNITLYGDDNRTVESMARALSHEYGHLYTFYYMLDGTAPMAKTAYANLRGCAENGLIADDNRADYWSNHYQYLVEVAAEDYVQLMGSPTTRTVTDYPDIWQSLSGAVYPEGVAAANLLPQENLMLPLAAEVPGLADYFYSFLGEPPPAPVAERQEIKLQIAPATAGYNLMVGYRSFTRYTITFDMPYEDAIYTVGCYDPDAYMVYPVKTVHTGQQGTATVGTVTADTGGYILTQSDNIATGTKVFFVVAQLPDGTYYLSDRLEYTF